MSEKKSVDTIILTGYGEANPELQNQATIDRALERLDSGDRVGAYLELYKATGERQLLMQAQITGYSGAYGGAALYGNYLAKKDNPNYQISLDEFSYKIDLAVILLHRDKFKETAVPTADDIQEADHDVWVDQGVGDYFPGLFQLGDFWNHSNPWDAVNNFFSVGTVNATFAGAAGAVYLGRRPAEFVNNPDYYIVDGEDYDFISVVNKNNGHVEMIFDKSDPANFTVDPYNSAWDIFTESSELLQQYLIANTDEIFPEFIPGLQQPDLSIPENGLQIFLASFLALYSQSNTASQFWGQNFGHLGDGYRSMFGNNIVYGSEANVFDAYSDFVITSNDLLSSLNDAADSFGTISASDFIVLENPELGELEKHYFLNGNANYSNDAVTFSPDQIIVNYSDEGEQAIISASGTISLVDFEGEIIDVYYKNAGLAGETVSEFAARNNASTQEILDANPLFTGADESIFGYNLNVSYNSITVLDTSYTVQSGDTLSSIAEIHNTTVADLVSFNDLDNADQILSGQNIFIPKQISNSEFFGVTDNSLFELTTYTTSAASEQKVFDAEELANDISQGLLVSNGAYQISATDALVNEDGLVNTSVSGTLTDGIRPGDQNPIEDDVVDYNNLDDASLAAIAETAKNAATAANLSVGLVPSRSSLTGVNISAYNTTSFSVPMNPWSSYGGSFYMTSRSRGYTYGYADPLVLDLDGDGVELLSYIGAGQKFDIDNDGVIEQTGWSAEGEGIVVYDLNGDGIINNVSEMLSEYFGGTKGTDGTHGTKPFANGFDALASLDSNGDNVFDVNDSEWSSLSIWQDTDLDGVSQESEMMSLTAAGVIAINLVAEDQSGALRAGNEVLATGTFIMDVAGDTVEREAIAADFFANEDGFTEETDENGEVLRSQEGESAYFNESNLSEVINVADKDVLSAYGGDGDDTLIGDENDNWLGGGLGNDSIRGHRSRDELTGNGWMAVNR